MEKCSVADGFQGDIVIPNVQYELEWQLQKQNHSEQDAEEVRKLALLEGLQVRQHSSLSKSMGGQGGVSV